MYVHTELSFRYKLSVQHLYSTKIHFFNSHLHLRGLNSKESIEGINGWITSGWMPGEAAKRTHF
jgi:hypothetical protein